MSLLDIVVVRDMVETSLGEEALQGVIDAEEAWLARRIGPLTGERVETFSPAKADAVVLQRPTDVVEVVDDGGDVDVTLRYDGRALRRVEGYWNGPAVVTYTPNDTAEVRRVLTELVRLALTETGYTGEGAGDYSYSNEPAARARRRDGLVRSLLPRPGPSSTRVHSSVVA